MSKHVESTSDDRTANNAVRHKYRVLTDKEKQDMSNIKDIGGDFLELLNMIGDSREMELAKVRIEEAVMWAVKHVTK